MSGLHATTSRGKYGNAPSPANTLICLISNYAQLPVILTPPCAWGNGCVKDCNSYIRCESTYILCYSYKYMKRLTNPPFRDILSHPL